ncbi:YbaB/EbfC family nucleoid-associated protein [Umezawaea endophytica]|uniref:YbaB/EbfC family nucleoid-associated protein n=1 Tax=Umezawaea endophytica TaxID=1654476 RepID=A0A9X2VLZ7_9PSEU|nr:YbaB/EbfC family nucleoid-associated protein [Umezawaea endophytica]MCS7479050.1 YbaB/EbfC family nucleoid-associated protein [Umezawaea endophytica]
MDPDQWLRDVETRLSDLKQKSADLAENLATATVAVTSDDGAVNVTISPSGALQNLELTQRAAGMSPGRLTASIMEAIRRGQRAASAKMLDAFAPLGEGVESTTLVQSFLPQEEDEGEEESEERDLKAVDALDEESAPPPSYPPRPPAPPQPAAYQQFVPPAPAQPTPPARPARGQPDLEEDENHPW